MKGILYISHGTRVQQGVQEAVALIEKVKQRIPVSFQEITFLEITSPSVDKGIHRLIEKGVRHIIVIPVLLLAAGHYYRDIPRILNQFRQQYPHIDITLGEPLGVQQRLVEILNDKIEETSIYDKSRAKLILVGRGSDYKQTQQDMNTIRSTLLKISDISDIEISYLAVKAPRFEAVLTRCIQEGHQDIIVVPYLWFTGRLTYYIRRTLEKVDYPGNIIQCRPLGNHPNIVAALEDRVFDQLKMKVSH